MSMREEILSKLAEDKNLPSMPDVASKLFQVLSDPDSTTEDIAAIIQYDPALASRVLRVANSIAYNTGDPADTIEEAIMRIGLQGVNDIVLTLSFVSSMPQDGKLNYEMFWRHSLSVAFASEIIRDHAANVSRSLTQCYTAGLLHDLGVFVLDQFVDDLYAKVFTAAQDSTKELWEIEQDIIGIDHSETGGLLLEHWQLPQSIVNAVRYHHLPLECPENSMLTKVVHIANFSCNNQGIHNGAGTFPAKFSEAAWFDAGLDVSAIEEIIEQVNAKTSAAREILNIATS